MTFAEADNLQDLIAKLVLAEKDTTRLGIGLAMATTDPAEFSKAATKASEAKIILDSYIEDFVRKEMQHV